VAGGLLWAAFGGPSAAGVTTVVLLAAALAGVFGIVTLRSSVTAIQAATVIIGLFII